MISPCWSSTGRLALAKPTPLPERPGLLSAPGRSGGSRWAALSTRLRASFGDQDRAEALSALDSGSDSVVLDDLDKVPATEAGLATIFAAIDARVAEGSPLLVTMNNDLDGLARRLDPKASGVGEAIASRLQVGRVVGSTGRDRRWPHDPGTPSSQHRQSSPLRSSHAQAPDLPRRNHRLRSSGRSTDLYKPHDNRRASSGPEALGEYPNPQAASPGRGQRDPAGRGSDPAAARSDRGAVAVNEPVLTKRELARRLKVSTRTIERLGLPATRVGGQNRYYWERSPVRPRRQATAERYRCAIPEQEERRHDAVRKKTGRVGCQFMLAGQIHWVPGGPWPSKKMASEAERAHRVRVTGKFSDLTCAEFADRWLVDWPRKSSSTQKLYAQAAARFAHHFGSTLLGEVGRFEARSWSLGIPRNLSKILGTMYEDARNIGLVETNPFANLRLPASEKTAEIAPPTPDEFRALLAACLVLGREYAEEFRSLITLTAWTGLRASEVMALRREDFEPRH